MGLAQTADGHHARACEIADRLMSLIEDPHRGQFTGAMQLGQVDRIPPVGLGPICRLAWDQRRSNDSATMRSQGQLPVNAIAARAGLITELASPLPARDSFAARAFKAIAVFAILPYSRTPLCAPVSASATAIVSLCTSRPT